MFGRQNIIKEKRRCQLFPPVSEYLRMKKLSLILPLVLILSFMAGCQDKEAKAELEEFKTSKS